MKYLSVILGLSYVFAALAQNLNEERIWKLAGRKRSIYLSQGVFHLNSGASSTMTGLRSSYVPKLGYERVVIDFAGNSVPRLYGHISSDAKKISIDFFDTNLKNGISSLKNARYVKGVDILAIDANQTTMEINLKEKLNFDIFYLPDPGRVVIDIRP